MQIESKLITIIEHCKTVKLENLKSLSITQSVEREEEDVNEKEELRVCH